METFTSADFGCVILLTKWRNVKGLIHVKSERMERYFQLIDHQRDAFDQYVREAVADPWARPLPEKWSVGETVYHLYLLARLVRRFSVVYLPVMLPYGHLRKNRPYKTDIHNIYEEYTRVKNHPMPAPSVLIPPNHLSDTCTYLEVRHLLNFETAKLRMMFSNLDETVAGNIRYPDPVAYYPNVIQCVQLLAIHEQHHFDLVRKYVGG